MFTKDGDITLHVPLCMATNAGQRSFSYRGIAVWDNLEKNIQDTSLQSFSAKLIKQKHYQYVFYASEKPSIQKLVGEFVRF